MSDFVKCMHFMDSISRDLASCIHTQGPYVLNTTYFNNHLIAFLISLVLGTFGCNRLSNPFDKISINYIWYETFFLEKYMYIIIIQVTKTFTLK